MKCYGTAWNESHFANGSELDIFKTSSVDKGLKEEGHLAVLGTGLRQTTCLPAWLAKII